MPGVRWPSVTRPADDTDAPPLLSAPRLCVCGHPVYDGEPWCPLCACQEHKPRLPAAGDHGAPAVLGTGEARKGAQPALPRAVPVPPYATAHRCPEPVPANAPAIAATAACCQRRPAVGRPGRTQPRCRARPRSAPGIAGSGHPARLWPRLPRLAGHANIRRVPPLSPRSPSVALKLLLTEVTSGLAPWSVGDSRHRPPEARGRCPAHPWRATGQPRASAPPAYRHPSAAYQQVSRYVKASVWELWVCSRAPTVEV